MQCSASRSLQVLFRFFAKVPRTHFKREFSVPLIYCPWCQVNAVEVSVKFMQEAHWTGEYSSRCGQVLRLKWEKLKYFQEKGPIIGDLPCSASLSGVPSAIIWSIFVSPLELEARLLKIGHPAYPEGLLRSLASAFLRSYLACSLKSIASRKH